MTLVESAPRASKAAMTSLITGVFAVAWLLLGLLLLQLDAVSSMTGFGLFYQLGTLAGLVALVLGLVALRITRKRAAGGVPGRGAAQVGAAAGAVVTLAFLAALAPALSDPKPTLNDVTTDMEDPPRFASDPAGRGRDMSWPPSWFPPEAPAALRGAYPYLQSVACALPAEAALELVAEIARGQLRWEAVQVDPDAGTVSARQRSRIFRFVDDVLVRVRPDDAGGVLIDLRSKSRDGRGDLGVNAERIRAFHAALFARAPGCSRRPATANRQVSFVIAE